MPGMYKSLLQKAALILLSVLLSLLLAEFVLRRFLPPDENYYVWQPNLHKVFHPDSSVFYGIKGPSQFTINELGYRGPIVQPYKPNYMCLGGSTTECLYLDNTETWPYLLGKYTGLNVGSIGKSGCTTREHYLHMKYYVSQLKHVKGVIIMVGLNDLMKRLSRDTLFENDFRFNAAAEDSMVKNIFLTHQNRVWWQRTGLYRLYQRIKQANNKSVQWKIQDDNGTIFTTWRAYRKQATSLRDTLPDLTQALNEYTRNLELIYLQAQQQQLQLILVNQAALYQQHMLPYYEHLLWMGGIGNFQQQAGHAYYSSAALQQGLAQYNQRLQQFCEGRAGVKYIDLASALPSDTSVFYDDCHFNEQGAQRVAQVISKHL